MDGKTLVSAVLLALAAGGIAASVKWPKMLRPTCVVVAALVVAETFSLVAS